MTVTRRVLADDGDRAAIAEDLTSTLIVEAAAGTGKTTELVRRIVRIIERGLAEVREIVAVTFTEKAAGELKLRLREKLETSRAEADGLVRERLVQALAHLEEAHVSTIHGFCAELLRERPVEARVDPLFTTLTDGQSQQVFDRAFMAWLQRELDDPPEGVRRALRRSPASSFKRTAQDADPDAPIDRLRAAAWKLTDWRDFTCDWARPEFDRERDIDRLVGQLHAFVRLTADPSWNADLLYTETLCVRQASEAIAGMQAAGRSDYDGWEARLIDLAHEPLDRIKTGRSAMYKAGVPRADVVAARDARVQDLKRFGELADADLSALLARELRGAVAEYESLKAKSGAVDFLDLLLRARDLLRTNDEVRHTFQRRFKRIFVDEFQDTDPVQAEIILLLAADETIPVNANPRPPHVAVGETARTSSDVARSPSDVVARTLRFASRRVSSASENALTNHEVGATGFRPIRPGVLFIVADPKQSIYRFRRADVGVYYTVRDLLMEQGARFVRLTTSFRAQPSMQAFVNAAFAPEMTGERDVLQAEYVPLAPDRADIAGQPSVVSLPVPRPYGKMRGRPAKYAIEASLPSAIAGYIDWLVHSSGWRVSIPGKGGETEPLAARHVCVLFRRFITWGDDVTRPYVDALEARAIPHVLVGGRTFHEREEVENMRAALTAIEWPDDELSVFATLKGSLFAIGDEELLDWRHRFGHLHPFSSVVSAFRRTGDTAGVVSAFRRTGDTAGVVSAFRRTGDTADGVSASGQKAQPRETDPDIPAHLQPLARALSLLRSLHLARNHRPIAETIHRLLDATRAHVSFVLRPRGEQVLANVLQVAELARQYELDGGLSFRGFVESLQDASRTAQAAEAPIIEEGADGVRLMTVHKAKGLEFPVVILADITAKLAQREPDRYIDPESHLCVLRLAGWMPMQLRDHAPLEVRRDEAEGVRLAYVAATRARDLLIIPAVGDKPFDDGWLRPLNRAIYPPVDRRREQRAAPGCPEFGSKDTVLERPDGDPAGVETVCPGLHEFGTSGKDGYPVTWWDPHALHLDAEPASGIRRPELITKEADREVIAEGLSTYETWQQSRESAIEAGSRPSLRAYAATTWAARSDLRISEEEEEADVEIAQVTLPAGRPSGARFGSLVHSVLSTVPLDADDETTRRTVDVHGRILGSSADEVSAAPGVVASILAHPVMDRARAAGRAGTLRRELPIAVRSDGGELVEGVADLAFEVDGQTVLVDFKTDVALGPNVDRYRRQLQAYGIALRRVTGRPVRLMLLTAGPEKPSPQSAQSTQN